MSYQLVVSGNRILAYGTEKLSNGQDRFVSMGGTVIYPNLKRVYQNATVVNCDNIPSDIDEVGYEYHAGEFVPCAPFGKGKGNIAVFCSDDCKSLKDSGIPIDEFSSIKLLWENASQESTFAAQTITLTGTDYEFLIVIANNTSFIMGKGDTYTAFCSAIEYDNGNAMAIYNRNFTCNGDTVTVSKCETLKYNFSSKNDYLFDAPGYCVPLKIYGGKTEVKI